MNRDAQDDGLLEQATDALRDAPVPLGPTAEVLATVYALNGRVRPGGQAPPLKISTRRFPMKRVLSMAAAVLLLAGIGAVVYHMVGSGATVAFAQVRRQIEQAQTMKMRIHMQTSLPGQTFEIEADCSFKEPGLMRQEASVPKTGEKVITTAQFDAGKVLTLVPDKKQAIVIDMGQLPEAARHKQVNFQAEMKKRIEGDAEELGFKEIDGKRVKGFRVTKSGQTVDIWVDPKAGTPVSMEMATNIGAIRMDHFVFGEEMDDALFSIIPPADYQVMTANMPLGNLTEADLVAGLKFFAELNDNTFPETVMTFTPSMIEKLQDREKKNKKKYEGLSDQQQVQKAIDITGPMVRMMMYTQMVKDFHYVGAGVKLGDADRIICRYKPKGSETYRVVYGDLHIADAPATTQSQPTSAE